MTIFEHREGAGMDIPEVGAGPIQAMWTAGAAATIGVGAWALRKLWRLGANVLAAFRRLDAFETRQKADRAAIEARLDKLETAHAAVEKGLAELPDRIYERFDDRFADLNDKIFNMMLRG